MPVVVRNTGGGGTAVLARCVGPATGTGKWKSRISSSNAPVILALEFSRSPSGGCVLLFVLKKKEKEPPKKLRN